MAESEGEIGYVLQQTVHNMTGGRRPVATVLTQVLVDGDDPGFSNPTKPVGPWFESEQADMLAAAGLSLVRDDAGRGRRVVASPRPLRVIEVDIVRSMLELGIVVVAAGGGGIPVVEKAGQLSGVEAVIDKDLATVLLAIELEADLLVLVTGVEGVFESFGQSSERLLRSTCPAELESLAAAGHFPAGTMGPKVEAAIQYVRNTGKRAAICQPGDLAQALRGEAGTIIEADAHV